LAGGGVVGKVMLTIPYLGYFLSFTQTKLGIVFFILIPALWILYDEIQSIISLVHGRKPTEHVSVETKVVLLLFLFSVGATHTVAPTHALLSDSAKLANNYYLVGSTPTSTPTPSKPPCEGNTTITINGNGAGSHTNVLVTNDDCSKEINQSNQTQSFTQVTTNITTGSNVISY
jgi:hypothetical protein